MRELVWKDREGEVPVLIPCCEELGGISLQAHHAWWPRGTARRTMPVCSLSDGGAQASFEVRAPKNGCATCTSRRLLRAPSSATTAAPEHKRRSPGTTAHRRWMKASEQRARRTGAPHGPLAFPSPTDDASRGHEGKKVADMNNLTAAAAAPAAAPQESEAKAATGASATSPSRNRRRGAHRPGRRQERAASPRTQLEGCV